jgi:hypothetical protein
MNLLLLSFRAVKRVSHIAARMLQPAASPTRARAPLRELPRVDSLPLTPPLAAQRPQVLRRLFSGRTIFLGPKTEQGFVHLIIFRLAHAPTPLPGRGFD